jgi:hypothetical protein
MLEEEIETGNKYLFLRSGTWMSVLCPWAPIWVGLLTLSRPRNALFLRMSDDICRTSVGRSCVMWG